MLRETCEKLDSCGRKNAEEQIKAYNVASRILMEMITDVSSGFTWRAIILITAIVCVCMCCKGMIGARKG